MIFEFTAGLSFDFVTSFAKKLGVPVRRNRLVLPASLGKGYVKRVEIAPGFKFVIHHYILRQGLRLRRMAPEEKNDLISIIFNSQEVPTGLPPEKQQAIRICNTDGSAIQIASTALGTETFFPAGSEVYFAVIGIRAPVLASLLKIAKPNRQVATILAGDAEFFYHERMWPDAQRVLKQLSLAGEEEVLEQLYYSARIQELLYLLFKRLLHRENGRQSPVNRADLEKLYAVRSAILADVSQPPRLNNLAAAAGMSETKMKQLFKQVFGDTIYNYYQKARMEEAAFLLRQGGYSVSEAGYRLGFSNLSHFGRLFEKHHGLTPKKYALAG